METPSPLAYKSKELHVFLLLNWFMLYFTVLKVQSCYYELQLVSIVNMYVKIYRLSIQYVMENVEDPQALH